ncbi:MAG: tetratricopeptide repeat protein [Bacteroidales bacterium]
MKTRVLIRKSGISIFLMSIFLLTIDAQIPLEFLQKNANDAQAKYDKGYDLALQVNEKIKTAFGQTNDKQLIDELNPLQKELHAIKDYGANYNRIKRIASDVNIAINNHNSRSSQGATTSNKPENQAMTFWDNGVKDFENNDYEAAIQNFSKVIQLAQETAQAHYYRGLAYANLEKNVEAIVDFSYFLLNSKESAETNAQVYLVRGTLKSNINDNYGAIEDYKKCISLDPSNSMAYNNMGWAKFKQKKYDEALTDVNKALELDNTNYVAFDSRAEIKLNQNDYKGCIADCDLALKLNSEYANSYFLKGRALILLNSKEEACKQWSLAGERGKAEAYEYISKYCN